jgi:hypothetical protein
LPTVLILYILHRCYHSVCLKYSMCVSFLWPAWIGRAIVIYISRRIIAIGSRNLLRELEAWPCSSPPVISGHWHGLATGTQYYNAPTGERALLFCYCSSFDLCLLPTVSGIAACIVLSRSKHVQDDEHCTFVSVTLLCMH